jgi:hypothetical protein
VAALARSIGRFLSLLFAGMDAADSRIVVDADAAMVVVMVAASS